MNPNFYLQITEKNYFTSRFFLKRKYDWNQS